MKKSIAFEDIEVGTIIPPLSKEPTSAETFLYSAVAWNPLRVHYDADYSREQAALPGILVHGTMLASFFAQMIYDWIGEEGMLEKLRWNSRGMVLINDRIICQGKVISKYVVDNKNFVECELWIAKQKGENVTSGKAVITLLGKGEAGNG